MNFILGLIILVIYHQLGEFLMRTFQLSVPGSVIGMLLLFLSLVVFKHPLKPVVKAADFMLKYLAVLFVPAGVGIMLLFDLIAQEWVAMLVSIIASTFISLTFTAWLMQFFLRPEKLKSDDV